MLYRKLDVNGDYTFGQGDQNFFRDDAQAVAQAILTTLSLFQGEWFLDLEAGVPWLTEVVGFNTAPLYDTVIRNAILTKEGVKEIINYSSSLVNRKLSVSFLVDTTFGQISVATIINTPSGYGVGGYGLGGYGL